MDVCGRTLHLRMVFERLHMWCLGDGTEFLGTHWTGYGSLMGKVHEVGWLVFPDFLYCFGFTVASFRHLLDSFSFELSGACFLLFLFSLLSSFLRLHGII